MMWLARTLSAVALTAGLAAAPAAGDGPKPQRIVSLNQCTDLFVLMLAEPQRIASLSFVTSQPQWTPPEYKDVVARVPVNHALAEEVLALKPDVVVTTPHTGLAATQLLIKLGYRVETFGAEATFADIKANILKMGEVLGEQERAKAVVAGFDERLAAIRAGSKTPDKVIAVMAVNGYSPGRNTLAAEAARAAGFLTLGEKIGYSDFRSLSLEQVLAGRPDVLALSNAWTEPPSLATDAMNHPAIRKFAGAGGVVVNLPERLLVCGSPAALDAAELMARARQ